MPKANKNILFTFLILHILSKCLNHMEDACKMLNDRPKVERGRSYCVGATNCRELRFYTYDNYRGPDIADMVGHMDKFHVALNCLNSSVLMREKNCSPFGYYWFTLR